MKTEITKRTIKVFLDDKHRKSFPLWMKEHFHLLSADAIDSLSKSKTLNPDDVRAISPIIFTSMLNDFLDRLKKEEKYVYELVQNKECLGARFVYSKKRQQA